MNVNGHTIALNGNINGKIIEALAMDPGWLNIA